MNATSARRIHRGKSRLGSIIAGHQQTADPTKARRSKILFRVIASSRSHANDIRLCRLRQQVKHNHSSSITSIAGGLSTILPYAESSPRKSTGSGWNVSQGSIGSDRGGRVKNLPMYFGDQVEKFERLTCLMRLAGVTSINQ
jgi:hypothetical protein